MDCRAALILISNQPDGILTGEEEISLSEHVSGCGACARELALQKRLSAALRELGRQEAQAPPELCGAVTGSLRTVRRTALSWLPAAWRKAAAVAAALLLLAGGSAGVNLGLKMAGSGNSMVGYQAPSASDISSDLPAATHGPAPGGESAGGNAAGSDNEAGTDPADTERVINPPEVTDPGVEGPDAAIASTEGPTALMGRVIKNNSTLLKVSAADLAEGRAKAVAIAAGAGAAAQVFPEQNGDKKIVVIRLTAPSDSAPDLIARLAGLGTLFDRQDESRDITAYYNKTLVEYHDLKAQINASPGEEEKQQLEAQAASYKQMLDTMEAEAGKRKITLWLEGK